ncbi:unnamed protein product [Periconia digitata]|uniref:Uncharacterized protein n=1 Tax=Periconia digitata TaxID=1303443 RepID=A0A9W4XKX6_9PLEO|nr:unnamed protein product [Periconia digitata]
MIRLLRRARLLGLETNCASHHTEPHRCLTSSTVTAPLIRHKSPMMGAFQASFSMPPQDLVSSSLQQNRELNNCWTLNEEDFILIRRRMMTELNTRSG